MLTVRHLVAVGVVSLLGMWAREVRAVGVPAGTSINNTALVTYTVGSLSATATSAFSVDMRTRSRSDPSARAR